MANESEQKQGYSIDLVMCIDATKSMSPIIDEVKANALSFRKKIADTIESDPYKHLKQLRVKVIYFRDYAFDEEPMVESPFFCLGESGEDEKFSEFVNGIKATGGGDAPEDALEALTLAMRSDWADADLMRHIIIMFTDTTAHMFTNADKPGYPPNMPKSFAELEELWEGPEMNHNAKRLVLLAPDCSPWTEMYDWKKTLYIASKAGCGCELNIDTVSHCILLCC